MMPAATSRGGGATPCKLPKPPTTLLLLRLLLLIGGANAQDFSESTTSATADVTTQPVLSTPNVTLLCQPPIPCTDYLSDSLPCVTVSRTESFDLAHGTSICAAIAPANGGDSSYMPSTGQATTRCIQAWKSNGRCDMQNNHVQENCEYDGGDCCLATCQRQCANSVGLYERASETCEFFCGENTPYFCLDDESVFSPVTSWCEYGTVMPTSSCYYTKLDIAAALLECILLDTAHGNEITASPQCGNATQTCDELQVAAKNGCHLPEDQCTEKACCTRAIEFGFIDPNPHSLPTLREVYERCLVSKTEDDETCFQFMVKCIQDNRAFKGGCCRCDIGWSGWRCRTPLCWPKCVHGECVAPNLCKCEPGWKGDACTHAICDHECIAGQGTCVAPNQCECFYGWGGDQCQVPTSVPACVNGEPMSPDLCQCAPGWGGRLCDYPLCQSWPEPSPDCGHGTCITPYECECEPGWKLYQPLNSTGFVTPHAFSVGQDVSLATTGTYVIGDTRLIFPSFWDRIYNSSNAPRCEVPDCRLIFDPRCTACDRPPGGCTQCEPGFFVQHPEGRCERCSNIFPHCQLCDYISSGPEHIVRLRCTHCDPLYVLEPMTYGEEPSGRCVSGGIIEFNSNVYHVAKNERNLTLKIQRNIFALEPSFAKPVEVLVRSREGTARSRSLEHGGTLANYELVATRVNLDIDHRVLPLGFDSGNDWSSHNFTEAMLRRIMPEVTLNISIFDDVGFFPGLRFFDIDLYIPPEHIMGHLGPLSPFLDYTDHETHTGFLPPIDFGRGPVYMQEAISTARVYIWDMEEASAPNTTCRGACMEWSNKVVVDTLRSVEITARTHQGTYATSPRDRFIISYQPTVFGMESAIGVPIEAVPRATEPWIYDATFAPTIPGSYQINVEKTVPGVFGQYWIHRNVFRKPPKAEPDIERVDHKLDFHWEDIADAPALARWHFILHFKCTRSDRWPMNFGHAVAVHISPGTRAKIFFQNEGLIEEVHVPENAKVEDVLLLNRSACERDFDGVRTYHPVRDQFLCMELLQRRPTVDPDGMYAFMVEYETPVPTQLADKVPAFLNIRIYRQNDTEHWGWYPVDEDCFLSTGLHIQGSPFRGFEALSGIATAKTSEIKTFEDPANFTHVSGVVDQPMQVRVDLFDIQGRPVYIGPSIIGSGLRARLQGRDLSEFTSPPEISWDSNHYRVSFIPRSPPTGDPDTGFFSIELVVTLDSLPLSNAPFGVVVKVAVTDFWRTEIVGNYTPLKASEPRQLRLQAYDDFARMRSTGGDAYWISFVGPEHDPMPPRLEFEAFDIQDNDDGTYDVDIEVQRPGVYTMRICPLSLRPLDSEWEDDDSASPDDEVGSTTTSTPGVPTMTTTTRSSTSTTQTSTTTTTTTLTTTTVSTTSTTISSTSTTTTRTTTTSSTSTTTTRTTNTTTSTTLEGDTSATSTTPTVTTSTKTMTSTTATATTTTFSDWGSWTTTTSTTTTSTTFSTTTTSSTSSTSTSSAICIMIPDVLVYDTLDNNLTTATGDGVDSVPPGAPVQVVAGKERRFRVTVRDTFEVQYYQGGAQLTLTFEDFDEAAGDRWTSRDYENGDYSFAYWLCRAGLRRMGVLLYTQHRWQHIQGSPFAIQVIPDILDPTASTVKGLNAGAGGVAGGAGPALSGIPASASLLVRDACGNLPAQRAGALVNIQVSLSQASLGEEGDASDAEGPPFAEPDIVELSPGEFTIFFTPMRRGTYELSATIENRHGVLEHIAGSPFRFEVVAAGRVPPPPSGWLLGAIGASARSVFGFLTRNESVPDGGGATFEDLYVPSDSSAGVAVAGEEALVEIEAKDIWGDSLALGNDTFLLGVWRHEPLSRAAACPSSTRCEFFAKSAESCARTPNCRFDPDSEQCRSACPSAVGEAASPFDGALVLADPEVSVRIRQVLGHRYIYSISTRTAGTYHCTASVLRPGGAMLYYFADELLAKRHHAGVIGGPLDYVWGHLAPPGPVPRARFATVVVAWLRVPAQDHYTLYLESAGEALLHVNGTLHINHSASLSSQVMATAQVELRAGYTPIRITYLHLIHMNYPDLRQVEDSVASLRLSWSAPSVPFQIVPVDAIYYEELLEFDGNPALHIVEPLPRASSFAVDLESAAVPRVTVGTEVAVRFHTIDAFGNVLNIRDPTASLHLFTEPPFAGGRWQGDMLVSDRWRLAPLGNGSWDLLVLPDAAPMLYNLTVEVKSAEAGGLLFSRGLQLFAAPNEARTENSRSLCSPPPPQAVGTRVTCTSMPYDLEGNEVRGTEIHFVAYPPLPPPSGNTTLDTSAPTEEGVRKLPLQLDAGGVGSSASFVPEVAGDWIVRSMVVYGAQRFVEMPPVRYTVLPGPTSSWQSSTSVESQPIIGETFEVNITSRDNFGNYITSDDDVFIGRLSGGFEAALNGIKVEEDESGLPDLWTLRFPAIPSRTSFNLDVRLVVKHHNDSLSHCPELKPRFGRVKRLSRHRALGSVALLECLGGFERAGGATALRCAGVGDGFGEWRDLEGRLASDLICRPEPFFCPPLTFSNSELVWREPRRQVGDRAKLRCLSGHVHVFGDFEVYCAAREGRGVWVNEDGDEAVKVACTKEPRICPSLDGLFANAFVTNVSADRDLGSVAHFACLPGFAYTNGSKSVICGADGVWKRTEHTLPLLDAEPFACALIPNLCPEPGATLSGLPERAVEYGVRLAAEPVLELGGDVRFECLEGYMPLLGRDRALCAVDVADSSRGRWVDPDPSFHGQVAVRPLRCTLIQDWCPNITVTNGVKLRQTHENYLRSIVEFACDAGYAAVERTHPEFVCSHNLAKTAGMWLSARDNSTVRRLLRCEKIAAFCPPPVAGVGVQLTLREDWPLGSELEMTCLDGFQANVPPGMDRLTCSPSPVAGKGQWVQHDGYAVSSSSLTCRSRQGYCPMLNLRNGYVTGVEGERDVLSGRAALSCALGYLLHIPAVPSKENGFRSGVPWQEEGPLPVRCTALNVTDGIWLDALGRNIDGAWCRPIKDFCDPTLPAFTRRTDAFGRSSALPMRTEVVKIDKSKRLQLTRGQYSVKYDGEFELGTEARFTCNEALKYHYSHGDELVICGYSADGTEGAWRSPSGRLAVPFHCYYSGTPTSDVDEPPVQDVENCFAPSETPVDHTFGRSGAMLFWWKPSAWELDSMLVQGTHGDGQWQLSVVDEGILEAQVSRGPRPAWHLEFFAVDPASGVGHVRIDISENGTRDLDEWYHIAFVWDLGPGLAGLGQVKLWVDGELSEPAEQNSDLLDHYTWVEPSDKLGLGAALPGFVTAPGDYSNLRVYDRNVLEAEITAVRGSEDPRCGMFNGLCAFPDPINASIVRVDNPTDKRFALMPLRPETQLSLECNPGYNRSSGDENIECHLSGAWIRTGSNEPAELLRCCKTASAYCPTVEPNTGSSVASSVGEARLLCAYESGEEPEFMGIEYGPCPELEVVDGSVDYSPDLSPGSFAALSCDEGFEVEDELMADARLRCFQGTFDASVHVKGPVPSHWATEDGREPRPFSCVPPPDGENCTGDECDDYNDTVRFFCPALDIQAFLKSFVANATDGRREGSLVFLRCWEGYIPASGNVTMRCAADPADQTTGRWTDATLQREAVPLECKERHPASTSSAAPVEEDRWEVAAPGESVRNYRANVTIDCLPIMIQVHGDNDIFCELGPMVTQPCADAVDNWRDSFGRSCENYASDQLCTVDGLPGLQWYEELGSFWDYANLGHIAPTACCSCGGGTHGLGVGGRWIDSLGADADLPMCALNLEGWCPEVNLTGRNSLVTILSLGYGYGSIATLRCRMGFEILGGHDSLQCLNDPDGDRGAWDREPLTCGLARHFCPPLRPVNATIVEEVLSYTLGEEISFRCRRGFHYLRGDTRAVCVQSDSGFGGQWKRLEPLEDGAVAEPLVCAPIQSYCEPPAAPDGAGTLSGAALHSSSLGGGALGAVAEVGCGAGFRDPRQGMHQHVGLCLHDDGDASLGAGEFFAGLSFDSRDLLRAIAIVHDVVDMLERHVALPYRPEDDDFELRLIFEQRWQNELARGIGDVGAGAGGAGGGGVAGGVRRAVELMHGSQAERRGELRLPPDLTDDHARMLHRLLVDIAEEQLDISAEEAREWHGAYAKLKINFQDDSSRPPPRGWLADAGEPFGHRRNGFRYGWKCDVSRAAINRGAFHRNRTAYTELENTLVVTDPYRMCPGQDWRIELRPGVYHVEVVVQDPMYAGNASGLRLQGESLGFPELVAPPGAAAHRSLYVDVVRFLSLSCDGDMGCGSVNRITMQYTGDDGSRERQRPLLECAPQRLWCPPLPRPTALGAFAAPVLALEEAQPLGSEVHFDCEPGYFYSFGKRTLVCGMDATGRAGEWRAVGGGPAAGQPGIVCVEDRAVCPALALPVETRLVEQVPTGRGIGSQAHLACRRGWRPVGGTAQVECAEGGLWCDISTAASGNNSIGGGLLGRPPPPQMPCSESAVLLRCEPEAEYCSSLGSPSAEFVVPAGGFGEEEPRAHSTITFTTTFTVEAAPLGASAVVGNCPEGFRRVGGDAEVVCAHGEGGRGAWQPANSSTGHWVDEEQAEQLVCELEGMYGLRRTLFKGAGALHDHGERLGQDIVPNIDQLESVYDASTFEGSLFLEEEGNYTLAVEAVGKFVLSLAGEALLVGTSRGSAPELFLAAPLELRAGHHDLALQFELDPLGLGAEGEAELVRRHVRLLWRSADGDGSANFSVVPPIALRHSQVSLDGFPRTLRLMNDPGQCENGAMTQFLELQINDTGVFTDGSPDRLYNPDLFCRWRLQTSEDVRINFYVEDFFDLEYTDDCSADYLELTQGTSEEPIRRFCGQLAPFEVFASVRSISLLTMRFVTNDQFERTGFSVRYRVFPMLSPLPPGLPPELPR